MNSEQISRLLDLLEQIASKNQAYTLTGASDWPILGGVGFVFCVMVGAMWNDQRAGRKEDKADLLLAIKDVKTDGKSDIDNIWAGIRDCKADCCDRLRVGTGERKR